MKMKFKVINNRETEKKPDITFKAFISAKSGELCIEATQEVGDESYSAVILSIDVEGQLWLHDGSRDIGGLITDEEGYLIPKKVDEAE